MTNKVSYLKDSKIYIFNVSCLSHAEFCPIRSKIEVINKDKSFTVTNKVMSKGIKLHRLYSLPNKSFDRVLVRNRLLKFTVQNKYGHRVFMKDVKTKDYIIRVVGMYDDLRVITAYGKKYTSLIEVKTTSKKYMWSHEVKAAKRQLQLYMWLLKEYLEKIGFPLWKRSYVEIYSQTKGNLLKIIPVEYDEHIEDWIKNVVECYMGLRPVKIPDFKLCKWCPKWIKNSCSWYKIRKGEKVWI